MFEHNGQSVRAHVRVIMVPPSPHSSAPHDCGERKWSDFVRLFITNGSTMQSTQISDHGEGSNYGNVSLFSRVSDSCTFAYVYIVHMHRNST